MSANPSATSNGVRVFGAVTATAMALVLSATALPGRGGGVAWAGSDQLDRVFPADGARVEAEAAFRVTGVDVLAERDAPEICFNFDRDLDPERPPAALVTAEVVDGPPVVLRVIAHSKGLCLLGPRHGGRYRVTIPAALRAADGSTLGREVVEVVGVPDRRPSLAFGDAGFLRAHPGDGLSLRSVNVAAARLSLSRMSSEGGVSEKALSDAYFEAGAATRLDRIGTDAREVWSGVIALGDRRNQPGTTQVPITAMTGRLAPGVYVVSARPEGGDSDVVSAQWFLVSDLGVNTVMGDDGLLIFARSLSTAAPAEGVTVEVIGRDRGELARAVTDAKGLARIDAGALTTTVDKAPQVLLARSGDDVAVVELRGPHEAAAEGGREGAEGEETFLSRPRLDGLIATDRRVYAPGAAVMGLVALRDVEGREVTGEAVTLEVSRPDGGVIARTTLADAGGGGATFRVPLPTTAMAGVWTLRVLDPTGEVVIGSAAIRVDDRPRLGLTLDVAADLSEAPPSGGGDRRSVHLDLSALTSERTPASRMNGRAFLWVAPARDGFPNHPEYHFGDTGPEPDPTSRKRYPLGDFEIGMDGRARFDAPLPDGVPMDRAFDAVIEAELTVAGTPVATAHRRLAWRPGPVSIGLRPRFDGANVPDGATVAFDVIAVDARDGARTARAGVTYELIAEETDFEWYETQGRWDYRRVWRDRRVTGGALDLSATEPGRVAEPVVAGRYRLEVRDPDGAAFATWRFSAGWWMSPRPGPDPGRVEVVAMRPAGAAGDGVGGDKAWVYVRPPQPSQVLLLVADRRVRWAEARTVGRDGALIQVPLDDVSARGAHVVATAFALPDADYHGPPRRAAGTAWLPGLESRDAPTPVIEAPARAATGGTVDVTVRLDGGGEPGFSVVALVPGRRGGHAFADLVGGAVDEPRLAVSLRDVQGRVIPTGDRSEIDPFRSRPPRPTTSVPPGPTWLSAITPLVDRGDGVSAATVSVPVPAVAVPGSYRLVAVAWNAAGIGRVDTPLEVDRPSDPPGGQPPSGVPGIEAALGAVPADPVVVRRDVLASGATLTTDGGDFPGATGGWLFLSPVDGAPGDGTPGGAERIGLAAAVARMIRPGPALGAEAAATRLLAMLALPGASDDRWREGRIADAVDELTAMWRPDGAFAAWRADGPADPRSTVLAVEALTRAADAGAAVPDAVSRRSLDWLTGWWDGCWADPADSAACVAATALLAATGRLDRASVLFLDETLTAQPIDALTGAHLVKALLAVDERDRAVKAWRRVVTTDPADPAATAGDVAAALAVIAETRAAALARGVDPVMTADAVNAATRRLAALVESGAASADRAFGDRAFGDRVAAWTLTAGRALASLGGAETRSTVGLAMNGAEESVSLTGPVVIPIPAGSAVTVTNQGPGPALAALIGAPVRGEPVDGPSSGASRLSWSWTRLSGAPLDDRPLAVGDAVTAVIDVELTPSPSPRPSRLSVSLPPWMEALTAPSVPESSRSRKNRDGVGVVFTVPADTDHVRVSFAARLSGPMGDSGASAHLEGVVTGAASPAIGHARVDAPSLGPTR